METQYLFQKSNFYNGIIISQLPQQIKTFNDLVIFMESNSIDTKQIINHVFTNNGTAYCYFKTFEQAKAAMNTICGKSILDVKINVSIVMDKSLLTQYNNQNIFIQYLKNGVNEQTIIDYIEYIHHKTILSIKIKSDENTLSKSAFVNLKTPEEAQTLNGVTILALSKRPLRVFINKNIKPTKTTEVQDQSDKKMEIKLCKPIGVKQERKTTFETDQGFFHNKEVVETPKDVPDLRGNRTRKIIEYKTKIKN